jgi:hypothetical protein
MPACAWLGCAQAINIQAFNFMGNRSQQNQVRGKQQVAEATFARMIKESYKRPNARCSL